VKADYTFVIINTVVKQNNAALLSKPHTKLDLKTVSNFIALFF